MNRRLIWLRCARFFRSRQRSVAHLIGKTEKGSARVASYVLVSALSAVITSATFSACSKVSLLNPDSNVADNPGITSTEPTAAASPTAVIPVVGAAMLVGGGIQTGAGVKVISAIGEPLAIQGGATAQTGAGVVAVPGVQGAYYQNQ